MTSQTILYLIKFFMNEAHADEFIKGNLFLNRLSYFKKLEGDGNDGRPDANEAVALWLQPHDVELDLNIPGIGAVTIRKSDLAAPVSMSFDFHEHLHVLCLYCFITGTITPEGDLQFIAADEAELKESFLIDARCYGFGSFAVVTQAAPFLAQLSKALRAAGVKFQGKVVEYYDDATFSGKMALADIPFRKQMRFSWQREFRVCVQTGTKGTDPWHCRMGEISSFSGKIRSSDLNSQFQVNFKPANAE